MSGSSPGAQPLKGHVTHLGGVMKNRTTVRTVYLYLVTTVAIIMALTGVIGTVSDALNMYVFRLIAADSMSSQLASLLGLLSSRAISPNISPGFSTARSTSSSTSFVIFTFPACIM